MLQVERRKMERKRWPKMKTKSNSDDSRSERVPHTENERRKASREEKEGRGKKRKSQRIVKKSLSDRYAR